MYITNKHFPLIQPFIHLSYMLEFQLLEEKLQENYKNYIQHINKIVNGDYDTSLEKLAEDQRLNIEDHDKNALYKFAKINDDIIKQRTFLQAEFLDMKLFETFLEGGPQSILQIAIIIIYGPSDYWQYVTIATSLLSFCLSATYMYLQYPTKVRLIIETQLCTLPADCGVA